MDVFEGREWTFSKVENGRYTPSLCTYKHVRFRRSRMDDTHLFYAHTNTSVFEGREWTIHTCFSATNTHVGCPGLGFSRISRHFQGPRPWIFKDFTSFSKAPALDFQGFHVIFKGPSLGFSRISRHFQGPRPWIFKDFTSFSRAPALDFQGFHVIFKGPGLGFSTLTSKLPLFFEEGRPHRPGRDGFPSQMFAKLHLWNGSGY